jgi:uncharacterized membrane protein YozB (DUF420 family)
MIDGFLGTRADGIVDIVMVASAILPFFMLWTFHLVKIGEHALHKNMQIGAMFALLFLVIALEIDVRYGNLVEARALSGYYESNALTYVFIVHLLFAISSFVGWIWLAEKSHKRFPIFFDFNHKKFGKMVFTGICVTVITGWLLYLMAFLF